MTIMASIPSFVTPGALISGDPNLSPGQGTLRTEGGIIATMTGTPSLEGDVISIPSGDLSDIRPAIGDHVIGRVTKVYEKSVELALVQIEGRPHRSALPQDLALELRVMKIVDKFLHHAVDGLRRRDIVRAKVVKTDPLVAVELRGHEGCGVLHALCPDCGSRLDPASGLEADRNMLCGTCGHTGYRVLSDDYVTGVEGLDSLSSLNAEGERWGSAAEAGFSAGPSARSAWPIEDHRSDGRPRHHFRFAGEGGGGRGRRERPKGRRLFVGGLDRGVTTEELRTAFEAHGRVVDAIVMTDKATGASRGFGFVTYGDLAEGDAAIPLMHRAQIRNRKITVRDADEDRGSKKQDQRPTIPGTRIYVGNLPFSTTQEQLKTTFASHGAVAAVDVIKGDDGRPKGFAFVVMTDVTEAEAAIEALNGSEVEGRTIKVEASASKGRGGRSNTNRKRGDRSDRELQALKEEGGQRRRRSKRRSRTSDD